MCLCKLYINKSFYYYLLFVSKIGNTILHKIRSHFHKFRTRNLSKEKGQGQSKSEEGEEEVDISQFLYEIKFPFDVYLELFSILKACHSKDSFECNSPKKHREVKTPQVNPLKTPTPCAVPCQLFFGTTGGGGHFMNLLLL